jgi:hypothetical protein
MRGGFFLGFLAGIALIIAGLISVPFTVGVAASAEQAGCASGPGLPASGLSSLDEAAADCGSR